MFASEAFGQKPEDNSETVVLEAEQPDTAEEIPQGNSEESAEAAKLRKAESLKQEAERRHTKAAENRAAAVNFVKNGVRGVFEGIGKLTKQIVESRPAHIAQEVVVAPIKFVQEPVAYLADMGAGIVGAYDAGTNALARGADAYEGWRAANNLRNQTDVEARITEMKERLDTQKRQMQELLQQENGVAKAAELGATAATLEQNIQILENDARYFRGKAEKHSQKAKEGSWLSRAFRKAGG